ncbi:MAG: zinc ribbon domain-containing protein [Clostridia bacterium]|nr:zinc ribbon domain-containing protein [Clostridia bacterium]
MKYCEKCGKEIDDNAVICPGCGASATVNASPITTAESENPKTARMAIGFAFLIPIVGIIMGIIGLKKYTDPKLKKQCIIAIPLAIVMMIVWSFAFSGGGF